MESDSCREYYFLSWTFSFRPRGEIGSFLFPPSRLINLRSLNCSKFNRGEPGLRFFFIFSIVSNTYGESIPKVTDRNS